jgi:Flp pilus assembly pilin Flp
MTGGIEMRFLARFWKEDPGAETVEYGLVLSLVALATYVGVQAAGGAVAGMWNGLASHLGSILLGN